MSGAEMRRATLPELRRMLDWAAEEGWNPGLDDAEAFLAADSDGFFVAEKAGAPVAAISVVNHADDMAFLGLYLCRPAFRGQGIGYALFRHALDHAGPRTVGLDGVPAQEANYARSGFHRTGKTRRLKGRLPMATLHAPVATGADLARVAPLDRAANGFDRRAFLAAWTKPCQTRKTVLLEQGGRVTGFATARLCREGCKIGPVVAPGRDAAFELALQAAAAVKQTDVFIDTPEEQPALGLLLKEKGFVETFSTARMYRGAPPKPGDTLFAIATMELG